MKYSVYWGNAVPFSKSEFATWKAASVFIKQMLDLDIQVHSVNRIDSL